jgi:hypothetical protein
LTGAYPGVSITTERRSVGVWKGLGCGWRWPHPRGRWSAWFAEPLLDRGSPRIMLRPSASGEPRSRLPTLHGNPAMNGSENRPGRKLASCRVCLRIGPTTVVPLYVKHAGPRAPPYAQSHSFHIPKTSQKKINFFICGDIPLLLGKAGCCILSRQGPPGIVTLPETDLP